MEKSPHYMLEDNPSINSNSEADFTLKKRIFKNILKIFSILLYESFFVRKKKLLKISRFKKNKNLL